MVKTLSSATRLLPAAAGVLALATVLLWLPSQAEAASISNDLVTVEADEARGSLTVIDRVSGRIWGPDPWMRSAGSVTFKKNGQFGWWDLSSASDVTITSAGERSLTIGFHNRSGQGGMPQWSVVTSAELDADSATIRLRVLEAKLPQGYWGAALEYPQRPFALKTDVDHGAAVIPYWQGVTIPSYIFPMNGGRFCMWDDAVHSAEWLVNE